MPKPHSLSRRRFLINAAAVAGAGLLALFQRRRVTQPARADNLIPRVYLPVVAATDNRPRVIHVHHPQAT
ncbi:MAG: twin-arginine translocation signal domain-containing protein, partial [Chloroflexi bacterium]|nr:twin-arginine translocation signal domain-containing protein [Chloroflexota bacterium]